MYCFLFIFGRLELYNFISIFFSASKFQDSQILFLGIFFINLIFFFLTGLAKNSMYKIIICESYQNFRKNDIFERLVVEENNQKGRDVFRIMGCLFGFHIYNNNKLNVCLYHFLITRM